MESVASAFGRETMACDVLVVGGGMAGCLAAIKSRKSGASVVLVEKAVTGRSGQSTWAAGNISYWTPYEPPSLDEWVRSLTEEGDHLNDPAWTRQFLLDTNRIVGEMEKWGVPFEKNGSGRILRRTGRGRVSWSAVFESYRWMRKLAAVARHGGTRILNRMAVTGLLTQDGRCTGAVGFRVRDGAFVVVASKATVLASGGCGYKGPYMGLETNCGEAYKLGYEAGADLVNMELGTIYNSTYKVFNIFGMSRFQGLGGRFINGLGDSFMHRYDPELEDRTRLDVLARAFASEVLAGRGPVFLDASGMMEEARDLVRRVDSIAFQKFTDAGIDPFGQPMEWISACLGTCAANAGLKVDRCYATTLPGLYAAGDASSKAGVVGAAAAPTGHNLGYAMVSGYNAGCSAAEYTNSASLVTEHPPEALQQLKDSAFKFLAGESDSKATPDEVVSRLQEVVIPARYSILRQEERLRQALDSVRHLRSEVVPRMRAPDLHGLVKCLEAESMAFTAEMCFRAALLRKDSRGSHFREDFPGHDRTWDRWISVKNVGGEPVLVKEPIPSTVGEVKECR